MDIRHGFFNVETWLDDGKRSVAYIALNGYGLTVVNSLSTTTYRVLSGNGAFFIGSERERVKVEAGSVVTIPVGVSYSDFGEMTMLAESKPPYDEKYVVELGL
jgi:mannose-6-phosphate isomerase-like protein (cupin superfamily)